MARKYHPDLNPNNAEAEKKFKEINEANEVLSHIENRKKYDHYGKDWKHADAFESEKNRQNNSQAYANRANAESEYSGDFSDFFESMFGGSGRQNSRTKFRGQDINASLQLNLLDVFTKQKQTITVNGKNIRLTIPAGIENGQVIKIAGHGAPGSNGGPSGDLYITLSITNNTKFKRESSNLYTEVELDLYTSLLGGEILADTIDSKVKLKVAPETQSGTTVKLKGRDFPFIKRRMSLAIYLLNIK